MDKLGAHIIVNVIIIVLLLGVFYRIQMNEMDTLREDVHGRLLLLNESLSTTQQIVFQQFTTMKADNDLELASVRQQLSNSLKLVQNAIDQVAKESKKGIGSLETELYRVQSTKEETLSRLQKELGILTAGIGDYSLLVDQSIDSVVRVKTQIQSGSGAIINELGYVITNYHVIKDGTIVTVELPDKSFETAQVVGFNEQADVALLKIPNKKHFPALQFGDSSLVDIGDPVISIGYPGGVDLSVSQGIISATNRIGTNNIPLFQTDVAISLGSSGGPLLDRTGKIVGINVGLHSLNLLGYERFGFSIKGNYVKRILSDIHPGLF